MISPPPPKVLEQIEIKLNQQLQSKNKKFKVCCSCSCSCDNQATTIASDDCWYALLRSGIEARGAGMMMVAEVEVMEVDTDDATADDTNTASQHQLHQNLQNLHVPQWPIPESTQKGPTCGIVALRMSLEIILSATHQQHQQHQHQLLEKAKQLGLTTHGEIFAASSMKQLIDSHLADIEAKVKIKTTIRHWLDGASELYRWLVDEKSLVLVPYDKQPNHEPSTTLKGTRAHWALVVGILKSENCREEFAVCYHGQSINPAVWSVNELWESCKQLERCNERLINDEKAPPEDNTLEANLEELSMMITSTAGGGDSTGDFVIPGRGVLKWYSLGSLKQCLAGQVLLLS